MMSGEEETSVRVYRALFPLRSGLEPFVAMHMQEEFGQNWLRCAKRAGKSSSDGPLDLYGLLKTMKAHWKRVFEKQFNQRNAMEFIALLRLHWNWPRWRWMLAIGQPIPLVVSRIARRSATSTQCTSFWKPWRRLHP